MTIFDDPLCSELSRNYRQALNQLREILTEEQMQTFLVYEKAEDELREYYKQKTILEISASLSRL
jgi:ribosomal protein S4